MNTATDNDLDEIARRHGFSIEATRVMWDALSRSHGTMAQFNHPEFGGSGQWMRGGMTMIGDMFNQSLKARVEDLCNDLACLPPTEPGPSASDSLESGSAKNWWPDELGTAGSSGGQNAVRYAYFPHSRRLAIDANGQVSLYDTLDHQIRGVSQSQSSSSSLTFTSQRGPVSLDELPRIKAESPHR